MPIAVASPDTGAPTEPTTTAGILGEFRRQLVAENLTDDEIEYAMRVATDRELLAGLTLKAVGQ